MSGIKSREKLFRKALAKLRKLPEEERSDWTEKILTLLKIRPKLNKEFEKVSYLLLAIVFFRLLKAKNNVGSFNKKRQPI